MKKVVLLSLSLALGFSAFAQQRVAKTDIKTAVADKNKIAIGKEVVNAAPAASFVSPAPTSLVVNREEGIEYGIATITTTYDLQSNSWCSNRMFQTPDGSVAVTATMSFEENLTASDRGTGYNFYNSSEAMWPEAPAERIEDHRAGWPTIAQWGEKGEILISHTPCHCWTREIAGEGEWVYRGQLPDAPDDYPYVESLAWPRVVTTGDNHNIIHVIGDLQNTASSTNYQVYLRSEDAENWTVSYSPLAQDDEAINMYSGDSYSIDAYGHTVAMLYADALTGHVVMYKSTDDGITWNRTVIWENPAYGCDWETDSCSLYSQMAGVKTATIAVDKDGVAHVAMSIVYWKHEELGTGYNYFYGRTVDGIYYWNDTQEAPIQGPSGDPFDVFELWQEHEGDTTSVWLTPDSTKWIGNVPMFADEDGNLIPFEADNVYINDYSRQMLGGCSTMPALSIDPYGNVACAYSAPCTRRTTSDGKYTRSIFVSYRNVDKGYWEQIVHELSDESVEFSYFGSENIFTISANNTVNPGEFWFGFMRDTTPGLYWGDEDTQQDMATTNEIDVIKIVVDDPELVSVPENHEAQDVVYSIYPNPATDYVVVKSSMNAEATVTIYNIVGQAVQQFNKDLHVGENTLSIDLQSGIYFCNINANGFNKTVKFIVK